MQLFLEEWEAEELNVAKDARFDFRHLLRHNCNAGLYTHIQNKRMFTKNGSQHSEARLKVTVEIPVESTNPKPAAGVEALSG